MNADQHCEFCGWEGDYDIHVCPKCHECKGLLPGPSSWYEVEYEPPERELLRDEP